MKVLFINDSTTNPNWGDRAAATSLMEMIGATGGRITRAVSEDELKRSTFGEDAVPIDAAGASRAREIAKLYIPPVLLRVRRKALTHSGEPGPSRLIPERWEDFAQSAKVVLREQRYAWPDLLSAIASADVAVIHGDGAMVGNGILPRTDLFLAYLIKQHFGKAVIIVNHTADFDHPNLRCIAKEVYPLFDDVVFRDPMSAERCESFCAGRFAADTAFWFEPASRQDWTPLAGRPTYFDVWPNRAHFDPSEPYLCLGGSSLLWSPAWKPGEMVRDFMALTWHIQSVYSGQLVLTASDPAEQILFALVAEELNLPLVGVTTPLQQAVDIVGNADAYITGRWHPAIFALRGGVPVIALSAKTFKMQALMRMAGLPATTFDALDLAGNRDSIVGMLLDHLEGGSELRNRLRTWAVREATNSWNNVAYLGHRQPTHNTAGPGQGL
jgi:polysaccharide pyruvyl transferase WcaK-like protein